MRFSVAGNDGDFGTTKPYEQFYNDQLHANAAGQATLRTAGPST